MTQRNWTLLMINDEYMISLTYKVVNDKTDLAHSFTYGKHFFMPL